MSPYCQNAARRCGICGDDYNRRTVLVVYKVTAPVNMIVCVCTVMCVRVCAILQRAVIYCRVLQSHMLAKLCWNFVRRLGSDVL